METPPQASPSAGQNESFPSGGETTATPSQIGPANHQRLSQESVLDDEHNDQGCCNAGQALFPTLQKKRAGNGVIISFLFQNCTASMLKTDQEMMLDQIAREMKESSILRSVIEFNTIARHIKNCFRKLEQADTGKWRE